MLTGSALSENGRLDSRPRRGAVGASSPERLVPIMAAWLEAASPRASKTADLTAIVHGGSRRPSGLPVDTTPPMCELVALVPGPPKQIQVEIQDTGSGLNSVAVTAADNANVSVPAFTAGTTRARSG